MYQKCMVLSLFFVSLIAHDFLNDATRYLNQMNLLASTEKPGIIQSANAAARNAWVAKQAAQIKPDSLVLDVGAGTAPYRQLFKHCIYKTHDFCQNSKHVRYSSIDIVSDITNIPVDGGMFDVVLCTEVFEHVPDPISALKELVRITKIGGKILITAPLGSGLHQLPYHFYGGFTPEWYTYFAKKFGLTVIEIVPTGGFFKYLAQECGRLAGRFELHKTCHGSGALFVRWLFGDLLPRYLYALEEKVFLDELPAGYCVAMQK